MTDDPGPMLDGSEYKPSVGGAIAAIVIGGVLLSALIVGGAIWYHRYYHREYSSQIQMSNLSPDESLSTGVIQAAVSADQNRHFRNYMEDEYDLQQSFKTNDWSYFAVYDGHGGRGVVEKVKAILPQVRLQEFCSICPSPSIQIFFFFFTLFLLISDLDGPNGQMGGCKQCQHERMPERSIPGNG
jgi:hypothetical protein